MDGEVTDTTGDDNAGADAQEPLYTVSELASGVEALAVRLDQTEDHFGEALEQMSNAVVQLQEQLAELLKRQAEKEIEPRPWVDRASPAQWRELVGWVDWLQAKYGALPEFDIPPCWPAHVGLVEELAGLFHSWKRSLIMDELNEKNGSNDLTAWHDRWLWPFRERAKGGHYRTTNCKDTHKVERITAKPTDGQFLPADGQQPEPARGTQ